jgi:hypothetical protein
MKPEAIVTSPIPLHPGAVKYYKEKGIKIPDKLIPKYKRLSFGERRTRGAGESLQSMIIRTFLSYPFRSS